MTLNTPCRQRFTLAQEGTGWRIANISVSHTQSVATRTTTEPIPTIEEVVEDNNYPDNLVFVQSVGYEGEKTVIIEVRTVNGQVVEEKTVSEEVTTPMEAMVVRRGTRPRQEVLSEAQQHVRIRVYQ